jgi:putative transposase
MGPARLTPEQRVALLRRHLDDGVPLTRLAADSGVPERTLHRWLATYRDRPLVESLRRKPRADRDARRMPAELVAVVEGLALKRPPPTAAFVHRRVADIAPTRGWPAPSYSTVRSIIAAIDPGLRTLALDGDTAYRDRFELVYRRTADGPNDQWQCDHTLLDVAVLDTRRRPGRPWLTVVLDDYSRALAGYTTFFGAPTAEQTALALHQAVNRKTNPSWPVMGLPDTLYSDHGSDFTSTRLEQVCLDTHVQLIHSRVGVPQGRGKIERFYRSLNDELLPHLPGHIPHGAGGRPVTEPTLTLERLDAAIERFVVEHYHRRVHPETGQPPVERWTAGGWIPRLPVHPDDLDLLLLTAAAGRRVQRDGVQFNGTRYLSPVLAAYVGEQVTVRYDPRDAAEVRIYHHDQFLCRAIAPELAGETITLKQVQTARTAQRKALKQHLRQRRSLVDALPTDDRYLPATLPPEPPALDTEEPRPTHGLRTYVND